MLGTVLITIITVCARTGLLLWPITWAFPAGLSSMFTSLGSFIGTVSVILPDGVLSNMAAAMTFVFAVQVFILPWLAARHFRLPFAAWNKP